VGVQRLNFDEYRVWCMDNGIRSVPAVQVFRVEEGGEALEVGRLSGVQSWRTLIGALPEADRPTSGDE
jgi:hypothetical protein